MAASHHEEPSYYVIGAEDGGDGATDGAAWDDCDVPNEALTSLIMAADHLDNGGGGAGEGADAWTVVTTAMIEPPRVASPAAGDESASPGGHFHHAIPSNLQRVEMDRSRIGEWLGKWKRDEEDECLATTATSTSAAAQVSELHSESATSDDASEVMGDRGMSDQGVSGEEWVLERILRRRKAAAVASAAHALDVDCDNGRAAASTLWEYRCKWKWYEETTWELHDTLVDMGYLGEVSRYNAEHASTTHPHASEHTTKSKTRAIDDAPSVRFCEDLPSLFPNIEGHITRQFLLHGMAVHNFTTIASRLTTSRLLEEMQRNPKLEPVILYHGTPTKCLGGIVTRGLVVPGKLGVTVANGSAHGLGIYTAANPGFSRSYSGSGEFMFVCIGLVGDGNVLTNSTGVIVVFPEERWIAPVWLVKFGPAPAGAARPTHSLPSRDANGIATMVIEASDDVVDVKCSRWQPPAHFVLTHRLASEHPFFASLARARGYTRAEGAPGELEPYTTSKGTVSKKMLKRMPKRLKHFVLAKH